MGSLDTERINKALSTRALFERADRLLQIEQVKAAYEHYYDYVGPDKNPIDELYLLKEIILRMGEGPEIKRMRERYDKQPEIDTPKPARDMTDKDLEAYIITIGKQALKICLEAFDLALALHKVGKLVIKQPAPKEEEGGKVAFLEITNSSLYNSFRGALSTGDFHLLEGKNWPEADISSGKVKGTAVIRPDLGPAIEPYLEELRQAMQEKVLDLTKRGDLAADVFDTITAKWLKEAKHYESTILITADDLLEARGLKKNPGGSGRRGGYHEERRQEIRQQIDTLSHTWITVKDMDIIKIDEKGKRQVIPWRGESLAVVVSSREGQPKLDGSIDAYSWRVRPGDVFSKFLFGPGRQTALLSQKALNYDPYRQKWEKRLTRYLAWIWRISSGRTQEGLLVKTLVSAAGMKINQGRPGMTRQRLEEALDRLQQDGIISAWDYNSLDENILKGRGWWKKWADLKIVILAPEEILEQYKQIKGKK